MIVTYKNLNKKNILQAFPLLRELEPKLDLDSWVKYANSMIESKEAVRGAFGAERDGYLRGIFCYEVLPDITHGRVLHVRNFVVLDMVERDMIAKTLYRSIGNLAAQNQCNTVQVHLHPQCQWAATLLENNGYIVQTCCFSFDSQMLSLSVAP
jgi:hypothetical protein